MESKETMPQFLARLNMLYSNLLEFSSKFAEAMNSSAETVTAYQLDSAGTISELVIPSIGYYTSEVKTLQQQFESMLYANNNEIALQFTDGSVKKFDMQQMSQLVQTLESVADMSFPVPTDFRTKTNWFFESFLNPLMMVNLNVSSLVSGADVQRFSVRRVILMTNDSAQQTYFDQYIKGRSDLDYTVLTTSLSNEGIPYHVDDNIVDMPAAVNRYRGSFTVVKIMQQDVIGDTGTTAQMIYQLDKLTYVDISTGTASTMTLATSDTLVTTDDTEYEVVSVNKTNMTVTLKKKFGIGTILQGTNQLRMRPLAYRIPELQINVGYNEREVIYISPISSKLDMSTDRWSKGFALYTNELKVTLSDGSIIDMSTYYKNFVSDFGMMFMDYAKEKRVPATIAVTPNTPVLDASNFSVVNVNSHIKEDKSLLDLKTKIAAKEKLENELTEVNKVINGLKATLNDSSTSNDLEKLKIKKSIDQNIITKNNLLTQLSTTIQEITLNIKTSTTINTSAKYRVRGFWDVPNAIVTEHGTQSVIQFKINYRYISKKGTASNVKQLPYIGTTGQEKYGFFSNWNEQFSKTKAKTYDAKKGIFIWSDENVQDPEAVNINQLDIPINKGEAVEIRIKAISEAGFPINPAESEWSTVVTIPFPDDIEAIEEDSLLTERIFLDNAIVKFQQELNAKGLDVHLMNALYTGDRYLAHKAEDIASGLYTPEGKIKDMFVVIKEMSATIAALESAISTDYGTMKVTLIDTLGNVMEVTNGATISLFGGFYKDLIIDSLNVTQHGEIITNAYTISIENTSATTLELASRVIGGITERIAFDDNAENNGTYATYPSWIASDTDYTKNRIYDKVPLVVATATERVISDFKQRSPNQSSQLCGQFIYGRFKEYGLLNDLYFADTVKFPIEGFYDITGVVGYLNGKAPYDATYSHDGKEFTSATVLTPSNGYMYMPYAYPPPTSQSPFIYGAATAGVWNGTYQLSTNPDVSVPSTTPGAISEFCLHYSHPALTEACNKTIKQLCLPDIIDDQSYISLSHALHFNTTVDEKTDVFGANYYQQCKYRRAAAYVTDATPEHKNYPIKNAFSVDDTYLIGKYTCGVYMFLSPSSYADIVVDGNHPKYAKKDVKYKRENAINIPVIFQFRCSDKLGYVGGYRRTGELQNVKYTKKIGIDIYQRDMTKRALSMFGDIFSFDIEVSCQYAKTSNIVTPITIPQGNLTQITYTKTAAQY